MEILTLNHHYVGTATRQREPRGWNVNFTIPLNWWTPGYLLWFYLNSASSGTLEVKLTAGFMTVALKNSQKRWKINVFPRDEDYVEGNTPIFSTESTSRDQMPLESGVKSNFGPGMTNLTCLSHWLYEKRVSNPFSNPLCPFPNPVFHTRWSVFHQTLIQPKVDYCGHGPQKTRLRAASSGRINLKNRPSVAGEPKMVQTCTLNTRHHGNHILQVQVWGNRPNCQAIHMGTLSNLDKTSKKSIFRCSGAISTTFE